MMIDPGFVGKEARDALGIQLFILLCTVAGIAFIVASLRADAWWGGLLMGSALLVGAASFRLSLFGRRRLGRRVLETWGADGVEIRIGLRPHRPLALLCTALALTMMFGGCLFVVESTAGRVLMWVLLPLPLLLVPDCLSGLLARDRELVLTPRTLTYRGWSYDAEVPWEDIERVSSDRSNPWVPAIRFDLRPSSTERAVVHKLLAWLDPKPRPDNVQIPVLAVDMPIDLMALAQRMVSVADRHRAAELSEHGVRTLIGSDWVCPY